MDVFKKPDSIDEDVVKNLGPFAPLVGTWEGDQGVDTSPAKEGPAETKYRERLTFEPLGPVVNGPQVLYGLKYHMTAWPIGEEKAFHEELGYWLWDPDAKQVMRCFMVPRAVTVLAGGHAEPDAKSFKMAADVGSETYGVLSNPFLDQAFKTVRYELEVTIHDDGSFGYKEDTQLKIQGQAELFHHTDENTLKKV
ncbi:MAG TPA: heme-binding beta-barrel domain-containing protein [Nitrospiria bacterium]